MPLMKRCCATIRCASAETGMGVKHRQQCQADTRCLCRGCDALGQLTDVVVSRAGYIVMNVVKFADPRETSFEHLGIGLRRYRLDVIGGHAAGEAIHQLPPGPEIVGGGTPDFR